MSNRPKRAFTLELKVGADSRKELADALCNFVDEIERDEVTEGAWGGVSSGGSYALRVDHSMTHERYVIELGEYLTSLKEQTP